MYPGLDISEWDGRLVWLWRRSNLRAIGFYLAHHVGTDATITTWTRHLHDLRDIGWEVIPFWLPFKDDEVETLMRTSNGSEHGRIAAANARNARLEQGATIYLDIENAIDLESKHSPFVPYVANWMKALRDAGYFPGVYCSRLNASSILERSEFRPFDPAVWAVSVAGATRAEWDDTRFQLTPLVATDWPVRDPKDDGRWAGARFTIGCQIDWFNAARDRKIFHWPNATGGQDGFRDVDWDMAKIFDPSHPRSASTCAVTRDRDNLEWVYVMIVNAETLALLERTSLGRFLAIQELSLGPSDIGPHPDPPLAGFDPVTAAAASRRRAHCDFFVLGQDGFLRTLWMSESEQFPSHSWPVNPRNPARQGSPVAAVSRTLDQLDIFYVDQHHQLVTLWWNPGATRWDLNVRVLPGPTSTSAENLLVAGGSNLAALPAAFDAQRPSDRLDVFYVSLNFTQPYADPERDRRWSDAFGVTHAVWTTRSDWRLAQIPDLSGVAAKSGIAAARDAAGSIHLIVQRRDRAGLVHAILSGAGGAGWTIQNGPGPIPLDQGRTRWWMSLHLVPFDERMLLFGMTNASALAWSLYADGRWSSVEAAAVRFSTTRPLGYSQRGVVALDIIGISEDGNVSGRSLALSPAGGIILGSVNGLPI